MKKITVIIVLAAFLFGCAGATHQESKAKTGVLIGSAGGAALGQAIGKNTESTLIGAGIGAVLGGLAGHQIGSYMDRQEQTLRNAVAVSDAVNIQRNRDILTATFKSDVFFDFDSSSLKPGAYSEIGQVSNVLNQYPETTIRVEGHTDSAGSETYNLALSEKRAEAVKNALVQRGVDPRRIQAIGFGESQPVSSSDAINRRVNIVIIPIVQG
jgi:outer membrane protein OmpA-like peptidoglycan-associated protein